MEYTYKEHWPENADHIGCVFTLKREPNNSHDKHSVAVVKTEDDDNAIMGHVPYNIAPLLSSFLARTRLQPWQCEDHRQETKPRSWLWPRSSMYVLFVRTKAISRAHTKDGCWKCYLKHSI